MQVMIAVQLVGDDARCRSGLEVQLGHQRAVEVEAKVEELSITTAPTAGVGRVGRGLPVGREQARPRR
jgi:hypothetical protein